MSEFVVDGALVFVAFVAICLLSMRLMKND